MGNVEKQEIKDSEDHKERSKKLLKNISGEKK